jgi:hypothetical protein
MTAASRMAVHASISLRKACALIERYSFGLVEVGLFLRGFFVYAVNLFQVVFRLVDQLIGLFRRILSQIF